MNSFLKVLTSILGVMAVIACLATIGIIVYSMSGAPAKNTPVADYEGSVEAEVLGEEDGNNGVGETPETGDGQPVDEDGQLIVDGEVHIHSYKESVDVKATCYQPGRLKYTCACGDYYFADVLSTGHVPDEWEQIRTATKDEDGLKIKRCIYCDEIVAKEILLFQPEANEGSGGSEPPHIHQYTASVDREASCILAGLRKYTCSCGSFYTERIPAPGHVATDWVTVEEPTTKYMGRMQRTCSVCGVILDSRPINALKATPSASPGATPGTGTSATPSPSPTASPTPAATPSASPSTSPSKEEHSHNYTSYVLKESNCTEKGIRSFVCTCGSSYAESIELDPNSHSFRMINIPSTNTTPGYTLYTCIRCNYSTQDNYTTN